MKEFKAEDYYKKSKKRILGKIITSAEITTENAWVRIHKSSKEQLLTYESSGMVIAINGSGTLSLNHPDCKHAAELATFIGENNGIIINGGKSSGVMEATSKAVPESSIGVVFQDIDKEATTFGKKVLVHDPHSRVELLATSTPIIVVFRGGLGTMMALMRAIVHLKNRKFHPERPPQMLFISGYWVGLLTSMMNLGTLPKEFLRELNYFDNIKQVIEKIPIK